MRKLTFLSIYILVIGLFFGCQENEDTPQIAATTLPVYEFTSTLCEGTGLSVARVVTEDVSCLHDYTLQVSQMRMIESAQVVVLSGAGLEDFLEFSSLHTIDASKDIPLLEGACHHHTEHADHDEDHDAHHHEYDAHIWLSPVNAKRMAENICAGLSAQFPENADCFQENLKNLTAQLNALESYGNRSLSQLKGRELITFHDGFAYLADCFQLNILEAVEEESGSEASAAELISLIELVNEHQLSAIFTERSGSTSAASVIAAETGTTIYTLDMAMSGSSYFDAMYHNIDTLKEALG